MVETTDVKKRRWYNNPLLSNAISLLIKSGILASLGLLAIYIIVRQSSILDAPVISVRNESLKNQGIVYNLPLRTENIELDWDVVSCEFDVDTRLFNVVMQVSTDVQSRIIPDPTISYVITEGSIFDWAFSNTIGVKLTSQGFIREFVLNSTADVVALPLVSPAKSELYAVHVPPQSEPGLSLSVEDQCGASVVAALKLKQTAEILTDQDRRSILNSIANGVLSYSESMLLIPRSKNTAITTPGTGLVRPFLGSTGLGPVIKAAASLLSIDVQIDKVEQGQLPAGEPPATANGIVFRTPGLARVILCVGTCQPTKRSNIHSSSIESFPQLGTYTLIPVVRRPFSKLSLAIAATDDGGLKSVSLGETQKVPGRAQPPAKTDDKPPDDLDDSPEGPK